MNKTYYDALGTGYDTLHGEEQEEKYRAIFTRLPCEKGWHVLDVGHATGRICTWLAECTVMGIDTAEELLKRSPCTTVVHDMNVPFPFEDASFDLVVSITAFHHAKHPIFTLSEMIRVARKRIIISLHTRLPSTKRLQTLLEEHGFSSFPAGVDIAFWKDLE